MNRSSLTRYAWLSIAAALATIGLKGAAYWLTGSVKKHGEYKGTPETHLTRCKVATEAPKAKRSRRSK